MHIMHGADQDADGKLSSEELTRYFEQWFTELDHDGDAAVEREEFTAGLMLVIRVDKERGRPLRELRPRQ